MIILYQSFEVNRPEILNRNKDFILNYLLNSIVKMKIFISFLMMSTISGALAIWPFEKTHKRLKCVPAELLQWRDYMVIILIQIQEKYLTSNKPDSQKMFGKVYNATESVRRFALFKTKKAEIDAHNELFAQGKSSYLEALNKFSDCTKEEIDRLSGSLEALILIPVSTS